MCAMENFRTEKKVTVMKRLGSTVLNKKLAVVLTFNNSLRIADV